MDCEPQFLRDDIISYCREGDTDPGNTTPVDQLCVCDVCQDDIQYSSPVPGLITTNPIAGVLVDCDTALRLPEFVIVATEPRQCPGPLQMTIRGY
jgi:hypothetical protein